jgi:outer membrane protein assembly factor BamA
LRKHLYILLLFFSSVLSAQQIDLTINFNDTLLDSEKLIIVNKKIALIQLKNELNNVFNQLKVKSFFTSTTDSIIVDSNKYKVYIHLGKQFKWASLKNDNIDEEILSRLGFRDKLYNDKPFNQRQIETFYNKVITHYENHGYPFASIQLDSIQVTENKLSAKLRIEKNQLFKIDSVIINGDATISDQFIENYIRINDGDIYNEELISKTSIRLKELSFVAEKEPWKIVFIDKQAKLMLNLKKKQASRFNGIIGLLSDPVSGNIKFTGDVKLNLINAFNKGEQLDFNWRSLANSTQDLKLKMVYPFLFNSPFGFDYDFKLYKRDTTYIDVENKIGVRYILKGNNYFKVFFHNKSSNILSKTGLENITVLPNFADVNSKLYGVTIFNSKLDYIFNPRKGYSAEITGAIGNKSTKKNPQIDETLYEGVNLSLTSYNADADLAYYFSIKKRSVIKFGNKSGYTFNENLFKNELLRIGGLKTFRGFDEESIYASLYSIGTIEYRFILEQNSFLYLFVDGAYYESDAEEGFISDRPYSFGAGMSFETKAGIFSINYAVGKQFDNPLLFDAAKVHFGFINFF